MMDPDHFTSIGTDHGKRSDPVLDQELDDLGQPGSRD
jgi:hypothetical protein